MEILNRFVPPFVFPLVPDIPVGIGMRFIGKIPSKKEITPPDTIAFMYAARMRIPENLMHRPVGNKRANPEIGVTGDIINNREVSVKRDGLFHDDVVDHVDP